MRKAPKVTTIGSRLFSDGPVYVSGQYSSRVVKISDGYQVRYTKTLNGMEFPGGTFKTKQEAIKQAKLRVVKQSRNADAGTVYDWKKDFGLL